KSRPLPAGHAPAHEQAPQISRPRYLGWPVVKSTSQPCSALLAPGLPSGGLARRRLLCAPGQRPGLLDPAYAAALISNRYTHNTAWAFGCPAIAESWAVACRIYSLPYYMTRYC